MAKTKTRYECSSCGATYASWTGKCNSCNEWNTIQAQLDVASIELKKTGQSLQSSPINEVISEAITSEERIDTEDSQLNDVLGGGIVRGSVLLLAGQPGIGKSTLLMQLSQAISRNQSVLYISGEESKRQVASRAERLGVKSNSLKLAASTSAEDIAHTVAEGEFALVVVDSIQTITVQALASAAGTVSQITNSTQLLTKAAKMSNTALILVGHVTKEGAIAGPKVLEHSVDVVLQFEGDRYGGFKVVRSVKNRYGSTNEVAIYEMEQEGLKAVKNPSAALLAERQVVDGSIVLATMEGSRPVLVEIQALVNPTSYGYPKRAASGFDLNRMNLLIAMLERRTKLTLSDKDIYINVVGGISVSETGSDLAVAMAIGSATKGLLLKDNAVVFGELGLSGEVRHVPHADKRVAEALKLGFSSALGPRMKSGKKPNNLTEITDIKSALNTYLKT